MICKKSAIGYLFYLITGLAVAQVTAPLPHLQQPRPELSTITERMEQAARENRERYRPYVVTREYRMFSGPGRKPDSTVWADISFVPPSTKQFKITEAEGSSRGENVVRHILENEQKAAETGRAPGAVTRQNYDFAYLGEQPLDGHNCFVLALSPKRTVKDLIEGRAWVDTSTFLLRRVEGTLARSPSWWLKSVQVVLDFGDVSGMWLLTHTSARAEVRLLGPHSLEENAVRLRTGSTVAELSSGHDKAVRQRSRRPEAIIGSFER